MDAHEKSRLESVETRRSLKRLRKSQVKFSKELRELADELRIRCESGESGETVDLYLDALEHLLGIDGLVHPDITVLTRVLGMTTLPHADSFWHSIVNRRRKKQLGVLPEKRLGLNKEDDERFAHSLGSKNGRDLVPWPIRRSASRHHSRCLETGGEFGLVWCLLSFRRSYVLDSELTYRTKLGTACRGGR